jgi:hypothetical protein
VQVQQDDLRVRATAGVQLLDRPGGGAELEVRGLPDQLVGARRCAGSWSANGTGSATPGMIESLALVPQLVDHGP